MGEEYLQDNPMTHHADMGVFKATEYPGDSDHHLFGRFSLRYVSGRRPGSPAHPIVDETTSNSREGQTLPLTMMDLDQVLINLEGTLRISCDDSPGRAGSAQGAGQNRVDGIFTEVLCQSMGL